MRQGEESVFRPEYPLRSDAFRSANSVFDGASNSMLAQPAATVTESTNDIIGLIVKKKDGTVMWQQQASGGITIGADSAVSLTTPTWVLSGSTLARLGSGGAFKIDTGSGGSYLTEKCFGLILVDHNDTEFARIVSSGVVELRNLPTTLPGVANRIWNDGGTLKITS